MHSDVSAQTNSISGFGTAAILLDRVVSNRVIRVFAHVGAMSSNENKMSDGGGDRASLGVEVWKSSQKWSVQRSAVRSIAWLDR
jgi:hypothetical protein